MLIRLRLLSYFTAGLILVALVAHGIAISQDSETSPEQYPALISNGPVLMNGGSAASAPVEMFKYGLKERFQYTATAISNPSRINTITVVKAWPLSETPNDDLLLSELTEALKAGQVWVLRGDGEHTFALIPIDQEMIEECEASNSAQMCLRGVATADGELREDEEYFAITVDPEVGRLANGMSSVVWDSPAWLRRAS